MNFYAHSKEAITNIWMSKLRSMLAVLGILVGTAAVVALISTSQMATNHALAQFKTLGTNLLAVTIQSSNFGGTSQNAKLTMNDIPAIEKADPNITIAGPYINVFQSMYYKGKSISGQLIGATGGLAEIAKINLAKGRFVSVLDNMQRFCVLGYNIAQQLAAKGMTEPLGKQIQVGDTYFTIVGVAKKWPRNLFLFADINQSIIIPIMTSYTLSKYATINDLLFRINPKANLDKVQANIQKFLKVLLPTDRFFFKSPAQITKIVSSQRSTFTLLLGLIGVISLIVGGIGVMNIMLVSVAERKREIGIRMAIGAKRKDISSMFLIEGIMITLFGGILGIIVGEVVAIVISTSSGWGFTFFMLPIILGFGVSVIVGILAGFYPAYRASKLNPIDCLESE